MKNFGFLTLSLLLFAYGLLLPSRAFADDNDFAAGVAALNADGFDAKEAAIAEFAAIDHSRVIPVLKAMLAGDLAARKDDGRMVIVAGDPEGYLLTDAVSGKELGVVGKRDVRKVRINNSIRGLLRETIASLSLNNPDPKIRLAAAEELLGNLDAGSAAELRRYLEAEQHPRVRKAMQAALALVDIQSEDVHTVIDAVSVLQGNLHPQVRGALTRLGEHDDPEVRRHAAKALGSIQSKLDFYRFIETLFFGLSLGSILVLAAIGLAITFGVMKVINMAHGELIMLGAYTTYAIQQMFPNQIELSLLMAVPAAFVVSGLAGVAIERGVIRFLYGRPLETLLATFGISLILQQLVRTMISAQNVTVVTPQWMSGSWQINPVLSLTYNRLYILVFALMLFAGLMALLRKTPMGLQMRAVSQNRAMAKAVGIRTEWVDALTFGLGSGIAGIAGVALSQLTNVGPNLGQAYIIDSFMVVVFGGVGNLWGTLVGGLTLGVGNKFLEPVSGAVLAKILLLVFIILFIQKRPRGLFPQKGRAAED
jgi:urea transport system permease protein